MEEQALAKELLRVWMRYPTFAWGSMEVYDRLKRLADGEVPGVVMRDVMPDMRPEAADAHGD